MLAAKSTMCRQCGRYFSPFAPKPGLKLRDEGRGADCGAGIRQFCKNLAVSGISRADRVVECFECRRKHEVSDAARSTNCPSCSAHIDLRDYKIATSFSRTIRTRGEVHLTPKGDLSSTSVTCTSALIEGKLRGNLHCSESVSDRLCRETSGTADGETCDRGTQSRRAVFPARGGWQYRD